MNETLTPIQQYVNTLTKEYVEKHIHYQERDELIAENNIEKRDIKGYHGREILELLQNADDAYQKSIDLGSKPDCELEVRIKYIDNILMVANTGTFFDKDGIKAIVQGNNSPKVGRYIGNKGTGFRSILNWATKVRIFSGDFAAEFSNEIASDILNGIKENPQIAKQIKKRKDLYIPMLAVPRNIEHTHPKEYTTIEIEVSQEKQNDDFSVERQLAGIDLRILLFLPNVSRIVIETKIGSIVYARSKNDEQQGKKITLRKIENGKVTVEESFTLFDKTISKAISEDDILKDIQLVIAVPDKDITGTNHVYSYFPLLETDSPFNCVFHATYALGDHRNNISPSAENKEVVKAQLTFLADVAMKYVEKRQFSIAYRLLLPSSYSTRNWRFPSSFSNFNLEEYYINLLRNRRLFETVNKKLISIVESPKYIVGNFPKVFKNKPFEKLLKGSEDSNRDSLIDFISGNINVDLSYGEGELCRCINQCSSLWNVSQQVDVFVWWNLNYQKTLPKLLKTQRGKWIKFHDECYFLEGNFDSVKLPKWVKVQAIGDEYQKSLISRSKKEERVISLLNEPENVRKKSVPRILSQNNIYHSVNFKYRDRSNIIPAINASVNTFRKSVEFVKWLWKYDQMSGAEKCATDFSKISIKFPTRDKKYADSRLLFMGEEYGNELSEQLFGSDFSAIPALTEFSIQEKEEQEFKDFLTKYGVRIFPEIKISEISDVPEKYDRSMKQQILDDSGEHDADIYNITECVYNLAYIDNLIGLLKKLSTENVIKWLLLDIDLETHLCSEYYTWPNNVQYKKGRQYNRRPYNGKLQNYLLFLFNEIPWIEINNKRYAPVQVLKGYNTKTNKKFGSFVPVITEQIIENFASNLGVKYNNITSVIEKFHFAEKITDLSSEVFYGLLLDVQNSQNSQDQELSRIIYRIVEQSGFEKQFEQSNNKENFFKIGKLLVKYHGKIQYYAASESYLPSTRIINKYSFPIVEKGQRTNNVNFIKIFGCKEYEKDASVIKGSERVSQSNEAFQRYFSEFQKYARAYGDRNENIEKNIDKLKVILVERIEILENGSKQTIMENYSLIKDTINCWYVVCRGEYNNNSLSEIIENIYSNIANTPGFDAGRIGELFRSASKEQREFLIKKDFGSLAVIEDERYQNDIKRNFRETLNVLNLSVNMDSLDIDFCNFQNPENCPKIITLFSHLSIDIVDFEKAGFVYTINLRDYFKSVLESFIRKELRNYKNIQYCRALNDKQLQSVFISNINNFECFPQNASIPNSVNFDVVETVTEKFGEWRGQQCDKDADECYKSHYGTMNPNKLFEDEIANDSKAKRMIFFGQKDEFEEWIKNREIDEEKLKSAKMADRYSQFRNEIPEYMSDINYKNLDDEKAEDDGNRQNIQHHHHRGVYSHYQSQKVDDKLKEKGNIGELLVYNALCKHYSSKRVQPRSEAFVELGIIPAGLATSGDYDLSYTDDSGNEIFVEVKSGNDNVFFMSSGELDFAKSHPDSYHVYFVYENWKYVILPTRFWEDERYHLTQIVEKYEIDF